MCSSIKNPPLSNVGCFLFLFFFLTHYVSPYIPKKLNYRVVTGADDNIGIQTPCTMNLVAFSFSSASLSLKRLVNRASESDFIESNDGMSDLISPFKVGYKIIEKIAFCLRSKSFFWTFAVVQTSWFFLSH